MKKHYYILGLNEGASQEEIQEAYERLSKELDPANNDNQEFFVEEFKKVQEAYKALSNSSILATDKGAKQIFKKPNSTSKKNSDATKTPIAETPRKSVVKKGIIISIAIIAIGIAAYFIYNVPATYKYDEVVFNKVLVYLKKDMSLLTGKISGKKYKGEFVNGKKEGFHKIQFQYYSKTKSNNNSLSNAEGQFKNNKYTGKWLFYNPSGQLIAKGVYKESDGKEKGSTGVPNKGREGLWRFWHENGQLKQEGSYVNGEREGLHRSWHDNGQLKEEGSYVNGKAEGLYRMWHDNGQLEGKGVYKESEGKEKGSTGIPTDGREGLWLFWHDNGQLEQEGSYVNGKLEGLFRRWHDNGLLQQQGSYVNGEEI